MRRNNKRLYESIMRDVSKIVKKHLNEAVKEEWLYFVTGSYKGVSFIDSYNRNFFNPHDTYEPDENRFVLVTSSRGEDNNRFRKCWIKKYGTENMPSYFDYFLCSGGSVEAAKYMKKMGKAIDKGIITLQDVKNAHKIAKKNATIYDNTEITKYMCEYLEII